MSYWHIFLILFFSFTGKTLLLLLSIFEDSNNKNFSYCLESDNKLPIRNEGGGHSPIAFCCAPTRTKSQNRREYYLQCKLSGVSVCILLQLV